MRIGADSLPVQLEEQRIACKELIDGFVEKIETHASVSDCPSTRVDEAGHITNIKNKLSPKLLMWPPHYRSEHSLRKVLTAIYSLGDRSDSKGNGPFAVVDSRTRSKEFADSMSHHVCGLCLTCSKEEHVQLVPCEHLVAVRGRIAELDPTV
jgi:hypothetical protein